VDAVEPDVLAPIEVPLTVDILLEPDDKAIEELPTLHVPGEVFVTVTVTISGPGDRASRTGARGIVMKVVGPFSASTLRFS